ncbi:MAG: hypothetical protein LLF76_08980 [Planctomycetaceae bacterium]|nr:hypothetical protein [Planctomycetaceae bacterium]
MTREDRTRLRLYRPQTQEELVNYVYEFFGFAAPSVPVCDHHAAPLAYLWHAYRCDLFQEHKNPRTQEHKNADANHGQDAHAANADCIVWANRGGGKTQLAAAATLLEGLFKPGCRTRVLAGSLDQSCRLYEYLCELVDKGFDDFIDGKMLKTACQFINRTTVQVLPQSMRAVRGRHVHKLRCDEIELFDEEVFNAAKYITHSADGKLAAMELLSTMHRPYGLMQKVVDAALETGTPVFRWCLWETIEPCTPDRSCSRCALDNYCAGKARKSDGYLRIDDCIAQMRRSSKAGFESEMLCLRPSLENAVFTDFDPAIHVSKLTLNPMLPLYRAIDFGIRNPFVCLWIQVDGEECFRVVDEYWALGKRTAENAAAVKARTPGGEDRVTATFCDPAGKSRQETSGSSSVEELRKAGIHVRSKHSHVLDGLELIRSVLRDGDGQSRIVIDPRCKLLIKSLQGYHYADTTSKAASELPVKDGVHDHAIDALRYFFMNYTVKTRIGFKPY